MSLKLCGLCKYFKPNGGVTSDGAIYHGLITQRKLGKCNCSIMPPYGRLKNETNGCDNWERIKCECEKGGITYEEFEQTV